MKRSWFYILLSLADRDRYGSDIQEDVRSLSAGSVRLWPATLYGSLEELVEKGWIRELTDAEAPDDGGSRARFYRLQPEGRRSLEAEIDDAAALVRTARARLEGA